MITEQSLFHQVVVLQAGGFGFMVGVLYHKLCCSIRLMPLHPVLCGRETQKGLSDTCVSRRCKAAKLWEMSEYSGRSTAVSSLTLCYISIPFSIAGDRILV